MKMLRNGRTVSVNVEDASGTIHDVKDAADVTCGSRTPLTRFTHDKEVDCMACVALQGASS